MESSGVNYEIEFKFLEVSLILNTIFRYYSPNEYLTIDEGMIPYNGNINFKVFNPDKPTKWGIKEYILCDS